MSGTVPPTPPTSATDSLLNPTFIIAIFAMAIVAATTGAVFWRGNDSAINVALGFVFGSMGAGVIGFYFGSSKGSQAKDEATHPAGSTTTTTTTPVVAATTTETTPAVPVQPAAPPTT